MSILNQIRTHCHENDKIRFHVAEDKIVLDTKVSKDLLFKLLTDDFLTSELTKFHYESVTKDTV